MNEVEFDRIYGDTKRNGLIEQMIERAKTNRNRDQKIKIKRKQRTNQMQIDYQHYNAICSDLFQLCDGMCDGILIRCKPENQKLL